MLNQVINDLIPPQKIPHTKYPSKSCLQGIINVEVLATEIGVAQESI